MQPSNLFLEKPEAQKTYELIAVCRYAFYWKVYPPPDKDVKKEVEEALRTISAKELPKATIKSHR
ncbi:hypothetical protein B1F79_05530 [Coxiella-like endosymbiont of Rhipicephalus sanguineus]|nr:hypothetical protein [Coxiella-like endosymbiont of Rhipicephalus sanguineus]